MAADVLSTPLVQSRYPFMLFFYGSADPVLRRGATLSLIRADPVLRRGATLSLILPRTHASSRASGQASDATTASTRRVQVG